jgi:hypothetical protein
VNTYFFILRVLINDLAGFEPTARISLKKYGSLIAPVTLVASKWTIVWLKILFQSASAALCSGVKMKELLNFNPSFLKATYAPLHHLKVI